MKQEILRAALAAGEGPWVSIDCPSCFRRSKMRVCIDEGHDLYGYYRCWSAHCGVRGFSAGRADSHWTSFFSQPFASPEAGANPPRGFRPIHLPFGEEDFDDPIIAPALQYIRSRNVSDHTIREIGIGAVLRNGQPWAVAVPFISRNKIVGWASRTIDGPKRYSYTKGFDIGKFLLNEDWLLTAGPEPAILVEGIFDALALYPYGVAFGGQPKASQEEKILNSKRSLVIALDGDTGLKSFFYEKRLKLLAVGRKSVPKITHIRLPPATDPNELGRQWIFEQAAKSLS